MKKIMILILVLLILSLSFAVLAKPGKGKTTDPIDFEFCIDEDGEPAACLIPDDPVCSIVCEGDSCTTICV